MNNLIYMDTIEGNYVKEFDAKVIKNGENYVILDKTVFYPEGGGQPSDKGYLIWENKKFEVLKVIKKGDAKHLLKEGIIPDGKKVHGMIDWDLRYAHMKMHTAQHIISAVVFNEYNARTVGNQIHKDYSRVDFYPVNFSDEDIKFIEERCNEIIKSNAPVKIYKERRDNLEKKFDNHRWNFDLLPKSVKILRMVEIENFDICPCAGTHVKNTKELPPIKIIGKENKGKDKCRLIYSFKATNPQF